MVSIAFDKGIFKREAIVTAIQKYLNDYWATLSDDVGRYLVSLEPKDPQGAEADERIFRNDVIQADFQFQRMQATQVLRETILSAALDRYKKDL